MCGVILNQKSKIEQVEGRCSDCIINKRIPANKRYNNPDYDYLWKKNNKMCKSTKKNITIQQNLSYTKQDLFNLLKRHSKKEEYKCCPFTANSIEMLIRFISIENQTPSIITNTAISYSQKILGQSCFIGKSRLSTAAACFYIATICTGLHQTQDEVAPLFYVTPIAMRSRIKGIMPIIDNDTKKQVITHIQRYLKTTTTNTSDYDNFPDVLILPRIKR